VTSRWSSGDQVPLLQDRRDEDTGIVSQWSGWLWLVLEDAAEPWPGWYEKNFLGIEGWVVDGEMGADVHCWTRIMPYPVPWPQEEES
jgi:hypothetical protein